MRHAIVIRELTKTFEVLLLDRPEDYFGYSRFDLFNEILEDIIESGQAVVFFSRDRHFIETFFFTDNFIDGISNLVSMTGVDLKPIHIRKTAIDIKIDQSDIDRLHKMLEPEYELIDKLTQYAKQKQWT